MGGLVQILRERTGLVGIAYGLHGLLLGDGASVDKTKSSEQACSCSADFLDGVNKVVFTGSNAKFTKEPQQPIHLLIGKTGCPAGVFAKV
ncbi:hypothetical protein C7K55_03685 [Cyanobium usitatum str. Tous]|uniref:Uncharacterized protein n=1 Tax=Cyanobium usitatum str. Tous TaxID=2116684 RepID=A0A2P7MZA4_9CYAN|nr:hypothetical protein C7K55_03685 [Cyanobium usitatum str. Tous]